MARGQPIAGPSRQKAGAKVQPPPVAVSGFNSSRKHFALALPVLGAADKVQVWDVPADQVVSEWEVAGAARVTALCWASIASAGAKKRRRKSRSAADGGDEDVLLVATTKADQSNLVVYSPSKGEVLRTLSLPGKVTAAWSDESGIILATQKTLLVLGTDAAAVTHTFTLPGSAASPSAVAVLPSSTPDVLHVIVGALSVVGVHLSLSSSSVSHTSSPIPVSTTRVTSLQPLPLRQTAASFLVVSEEDRTVSQYTLTTPTAMAKLSYRFASPTLSPVHSVAISSDYLAALHMSGDVAVFPLPEDLDLVRPKTDSKPRSVKLIEGKEETTATLCRVEFAAVDEGQPAALWCGRMAGAGRVKWYTATIEQPDGGLSTSTVVKCDAQDLLAANKSAGGLATQRFKAPANAIQVENEDAAEPASTLPADVDMAELSLGERLLAAPSTGARANGDAAPKADGPVNAASLTRLLVQALHTSDPALLTLCLSHRDPVLIRNTVRKLPVQMSLPLLKACVERLGQGKGANRRGGGRGNMQNEQQGRGTVEWVKGVLIERGSILMTMPSLPAQLAALSNLLATRMELYQPLLALSGRLDLALAQINVRRLAAEQAQSTDTKGEGEHYVEGESDDEVPIEMGEEDEDDIEDVNMLGGDSDEEEDEDDDDEDDDDDEELDSGSEDLLDLEAEEADSDEEEEESDEE